jgi:hypothetical protein
MGVAAAVLLGTGLVLMIVPPVVRDGICGLTSCAEQVPVIAVSRGSSSELAVVVPDEAAPTVRSVEVLQGGGRGSGSRRWLIQRDADARGDGEDPTTFLIGSEPSGFRTVVPLDEAPVSGVWTAQVGFECTTASLPFDPTAIAVGEVRSWDGAMDGNDFADTAVTSEHCVPERSSTEVVLMVVGAVLAVAGAVLGIVVVLRRPVRFPEDPDGEGPAGEVAEWPEPGVDPGSDDADRV